MREGPTGQERVLDPVALELTDVCEQSCGYLELDLGLLQEQLSLQPLLSHS